MTRYHATGYALLVAFAIGVLWLFGLTLPWAAWKADGNLAAWVQAIGSLVAIIVAIAVPAVQHALAEQRIAAESAARVRRQHALVLLVGEGFLQACHALQTAIQRKTVMGGSPVFPDDAVADLRELARSVDYGEIRPEAMALVSEAKRLVGLLESHYRNASGQIPALASLSDLDDVVRGFEPKLATLRRLLAAARLV